MKESFELVSASVMGRDHLKMSKNNQDAVYTHQDDDLTIAIVCDGCGSKKHSEVGAEIGSRLIGQSLRKYFARNPESAFGTNSQKNFFEKVRLDVLAQLRVLAISMSDSLTAIVNDYLLFTVVGVIISKYGTCIFSIGDGIYAINDEIYSIGPFMNNEPPYLTYDLVDSGHRDVSFQVHSTMECDQCESVMIATDGLEYLIKASNQNIPGKKESIGLVNQFWDDDRYFTNFDSLRRKLAQINKESAQINWITRTIEKESGILNDDTSIVIIRRKRGVL